MMASVTQLSGHIVDILNENIFDGTVIIQDGIIKDIIPNISGNEISDQFILPGFIDAHIHIESSLLLPRHFASLAVRQGTIAVVTDPHEIANVLGMDGVRFMIENGEQAPFYFYFCAPSCVPSTIFETAGATLDAKAVDTLLGQDNIFALSEMMNSVGVLTHDPMVWEKINAAHRHKKPIDGHAPGLRGQQASQYIAAGISTDHECTTLQEAEERIALGMKVLIREGSAACDFDELCQLLSRYKSQIMFCTDDKYADELELGHINHLVQRAIAKGLPLWNVLRAACITPHEHYKLNHGLLRSGDPADFIVVDNLQQFNIHSTFIKGNEVFNAKQPFKELPTSIIPESAYPNNFHALPIEAKSLRVHAEYDQNNNPKQLKVIQATEGSLITRCVLVPPKISDGMIVTNIDEDILKLVVYNRYTPAPPQVAFLKGFGLKRGAIATTIAHDCHNIIALGCSDDDITAAINRLITLRGGMVVCDGENCGELPLPVGGLMSPLPGNAVASQHRNLQVLIHSLGCQFAAPFMTLSFMALPVIPDLKLTDKGLFDGSTFTFTSIFQ